MRIIISAMVFLMASVTVAGTFLTVILSAPDLMSWSESNAIIAVVVLGFLCAVPLSYWIAGKILDATRPVIGPKGDAA